MDRELANEVRDRVRPAVEQVIALAAERSLSMIEVRQGDLEIRVERRATSVVHSSQETLPAVPAVDEHHRMVAVRSTHVGIFRLRPSPEKPAVAQVGLDVEAGRVLGYIESMGLRYEVPAPVTGRMAEILVEEGHPVEFGQPLLVLEADE